MKRIGNGLMLLFVCGAWALNVRCAAGDGDLPAAPPQEEVRRARLLFAGDVMQHLPQVEAARRGTGHDFGEQFRHVAARFAAADLVFVNLETTLSPTPPYTGYPCFRTPDALAHDLRRAGVDVALTANNHCCDGGRRGLLATLSALDRAGIRHTGTFADGTDRLRGHPLLMDAGGIRFAVVNYTYGTNGIPVPEGCVVNRIDTAAMAADLAVARARADCVIAVMHWGVEYARLPDAGQRALADFLRRHGAQVVIGHHPHVVQPFAADSTGAVFYSLGNFVSNQRRRYCDGGLLAEVEVTLRAPAGHVGGMLWQADSARRIAVKAAAVPVWVALPGYRIVPPEAGDTLSLAEPARRAYETFLADTRALLAQ